MNFVEIDALSTAVTLSPADSDHGFLTCLPVRESSGTRLFNKRHVVTNSVDKYYIG